MFKYYVSKKTYIQIHLFQTLELQDVAFWSFFILYFLKFSNLNATTISKVLTILSQITKSDKLLDQFKRDQFNLQLYRRNQVKCRCGWAQ